MQELNEWRTEALVSFMYLLVLKVGYNGSSLSSMFLKCEDVMVSQNM